MFGFQRAIPAAVMVRETPWDQTPHVMITHGHTWARIFVCSSYKYFLGACMDARTQPLATGGISGCGNHDEYSSVGISDVSGRVPTPVMGREMLEALLLNKTSHGHMSLCRQENHPKSKDYDVMLKKSSHGQCPYVTVQVTYNHQNQNITHSKM